MTNVVTSNKEAKGENSVNENSEFILQKIFKTEDCFYEGRKCLIGRKEAEEMLRFNNKNRKLTPRLVTRYSKLMDEGEWKFSPNSWVGLTKGLLLPDKQHTLNAIVKSGKPQWFYVYSELDDDLIFYLDEGKKRTAGDLGRILKIKDYNLMCSVSRSVIKFQSGGTGTATAIQSDINSDTKAVLTNKKIVERAQSDARVRSATDMANMLKGQKPILLTGAQIGLYYYVFSEIDEQDAFSFMQKLILGIDLKELSPIKKLRDHLTSEKMRGRKVTGQTLEFYLKRAWYKFRRNENQHQFKLFKKDESKMPKII